MPCSFLPPDVEGFVVAEVPAAFAALGVLAAAATHLKCQGALAVVISTVHSNRCVVAPLAGEALASEAAAALREDKYLSDGSKPRLYMFFLTSLIVIAPASLVLDTGLKTDAAQACNEALVATVKAMSKPRATHYLGRVTSIPGKGGYTEFMSLCFVHC